MGARWPVLVVALLVVACGDGGGGSPGVTPSAQPSATLPAPTPTVAPATPAGTVVAPSSRDAPWEQVRVDADAVVRIPMLSDGLIWLPVAALGDGVLLKGTSPAPDAFGSDRHEYFDPATGARMPLWSSSPGRQEVIHSADGDWLAIVRTGPSLPFADWQLLLRNWRTGEVRELAQSDPQVLTYPGLHIGLPVGFAPTPSVRDGLAVWDEYFVHGEGVGKRIRQYDIASDVTTTLYEVSDARLEELLRPSTSRGVVAWIHLILKDGRGDIPADMTVDLLDTEENLRKIVLPGEPYVIALSSEGDILYWSTLEPGQHATDLESLQTATLAQGLGQWVYVSGPRVGWAPGGLPTDIGYYDESTDTAYSVTLYTDRPGGTTNLAQPLGKWFAWSVRVDLPEGGSDFEASSLYFLALD